MPSFGIVIRGTTHHWCIVKADDQNDAEEAALAEVQGFGVPDGCEIIESGNNDELDEYYVTRNNDVSDDYPDEEEGATDE